MKIIVTAPRTTTVVVIHTTARMQTHITDTLVRRDMVMDIHTADLIMKTVRRPAEPAAVIIPIWWIYELFTVTVITKGKKNEAVAEFN